MSQKAHKKAALVVSVISVVFTIHDILFALVDSGSKMNSVYWTLTAVIAVIIGLVYIGGISYCYMNIYFLRKHGNRKNACKPNRTKSCPKKKQRE